MTSYAIAMTTSAWAPFVERQFRRTREHVGHGDMFVLANETDGPLDIPADCAALRVSENQIRQLGLPIVYDESLFCYNLDYYYIYFHLLKPDYDYYVFLDYSAVFDTDMDALIERIAAERLDLVAEPVAGPLSDWTFAKSHAALYPPGTLEAVMLPMVVLSRETIAHLAKRRRDLSPRLAQDANFAWPFCEAFVPTELKLAGFASAPLSAYGSVERLGWWPPMLETALAAERAPGFIHPLLDRRRYLDYLLRHMRPRDLLRPGFHRRALRDIPVRSYTVALAAELGRRARRAALAWLSMRPRAPMTRAKPSRAAA